jgi:Cohesin domain
MRKKRTFLWLGIGAAAAGGAAWLGLPYISPDLPGPKGVAVAQAGARQDAASEPRWTKLPAREGIGKPAGELFFPHSWAPAEVKPAASAGASVPAKPTPPPMPYRIAGKVVAAGVPQIVLAKGDSIVTVREGDKLDDGYRIESIKRDHVVMLYMPLGMRERLPLSATFIIDESYADAEPVAPAPTQAIAPLPTSEAAVDSHPAQLRWEGPEEVKAGDAFNVALKLTSDQTLRSVPLQVSFDAALLEPVNVRPGKLFADGLFSYRINPEGSIFVGASGKGTVAADAEILVLTFKPLRSGETAELTVSSMLLQDAAGSAIAHDHPAAFRTAIVQ